MMLLSLASASPATSTRPVCTPFGALQGSTTSFTETPVDGESRESRDLAASWRTLVEQSPHSTVEMHPECVLGDSESAAGSRGLVLHTSDESGSLENLAILAEKTVQLPLIRGLGWRLPLRGARLVGSRVLGTASPAAEAAYADKFAELLSGPDACYDCLLLEDLSVDSSWWKQLSARSDVRAITLVEPQTRWQLCFPEEGGADGYWSQFSSKTRYNFRRQRRLFEHTWEVVRDAEQVDKFLDDAGQVSSQSWQGKRLGQRVRRDSELATQMRRLAELGALRCYLLRTQGAPAAFAIGTQWNGRYSLEEIGYDTQFAASSPGTVLLLNMLDDFFANDPPSCLDFGFGDGAYKRLFGNCETASGSLLLVSRRWAPALTTLLHRAGTRAEQGLRSLVRSLGVEGWLRKIYRR